MFEPRPNADFSAPVPRQIVRLKTRRRLRIEAATKTECADNPFLALMLDHPAPVAPLAPCAKREPKERIFGIVRKPSSEPAKVRRVPQPYIFMGGKRVSTGPSRRWSQK